MPVLTPEKRKHNFSEISLGLSAEAAQKEAARCLSCGCQDVNECKLRDLAAEYQVDDKKYAGQKRHIAVKKEEHPFILRDQNKCILCGRCVRICSEVEGVSALGFVHRASTPLSNPHSDCHWRRPLVTPAAFASQPALPGQLSSSCLCPNPALFYLLLSLLFVRNAALPAAASSMFAGNN